MMAPPPYASPTVSTPMWQQPQQPRKQYYDPQAAQAAAAMGLSGAAAVGVAGLMAGQQLWGMM